jgi:CRISPR-associated protein Cas2
LSDAAPHRRHGNGRRGTTRHRENPLSKRLLYLVCYDVRCPRRLARVLKVVKAWSTGGQKSVHECWLGPAELARLERELTAEIDRSEDSLLILRPDLGAGVRTLGIAQRPRDPRFLYVG